LVGTTDFPVVTPDDAHISAEETAYLLTAVNHFRRTPLEPADIVGSYAGIRALYDDGAGSASAVSRDYHLDLDTDGASLLSVFGGKITTARHLADDVLTRLGMEDGETRRRPLPGGDFTDFAALLDTARRCWPFLDEGTIARMARAYGTRIAQMIGNAACLGDMGQDFGFGLYAREVDYLIDREWARSAQDIIWRRSRLGLFMDTSQVEALQIYVAGRTA
jgi:glycerol-3-phosphate dehydrogenase